MKLLIVLCLGTLALSAPAPQKGSQIDFLYDDDETQASVRPVEINTVEPKVTATKISDHREPAPVFEEDEADVQEEEPSPIASPLNLEQNESDNSERSAQVNETVSDDFENENKTESTVTDRTDSAVTDTTIRVYDEDEVNGAIEKEEYPEQEQEQEQKQDQEQEQDQDQGQEQEHEQKQEQQREQGWENEHEHEWEQEHEREQEQARHNQINQKAVILDSYQYDDTSLERELQNEESPEKPTTAAFEPNSNKPVINGDLNVELNHETQVVEKGSFGIQDLKTSVTIPVKPENREYAGLADWGPVHQEAVTNDDMNVELKSGQLFNHGTLVLEKGTFEGQDMNHPFTGPFPMKQWKMGENHEFANWHHGPHGHRGDHEHPNFPGSQNEHHRFDGPPPPWVQGPHFHHQHFDHKSHEHKGYTFHGNGFHRDVPAWNSHWGNPNSVPPTN